jgi:predicted AAA+ superfamily ATPase
MSESIQKFKKFPVIAIVGPRQSGKTTFTKKYFTEHIFVSFEQESVRQEAEQDPAKNYVIYAGDTTEERNLGMMVSWVNFGDVIDRIET